MKTFSHPDFALVFALPVGKAETASDDPTAKLTEAELDDVREQIKAKSQDAYHTIRLERATSIKISSVRSVREFLSLSPSRTAGRKVVVILNADMMRAQAQNAFLKTLEEPRGDSTVILTTAHPDRLLETVRSRAQRINFSLLQEREIARALEERNLASGEKAIAIASIAEGSVTKALALATTDVESEREDVVSFLRTVLKSDWVAMASIVERWSREERLENDRKLALLASWMRDALALREGAKPVIHTTTIEKFSAGYAHVRFTRAISICGESRNHIRSNVRLQTVWYSLAAGFQEIFSIIQ